MHTLHNAMDNISKGGERVDPVAWLSTPLALPSPPTLSSFPPLSLRRHVPPIAIPPIGLFWVGHHHLPPPFLPRCIREKRYLRR